jgi:hypothetical protein
MVLLAEVGVLTAAIHVPEPLGVSTCHVPFAFQFPPPVPFVLKLVWAIPLYAERSIIETNDILIASLYEFITTD